MLLTVGTLVLLLMLCIPEKGIAFGEFQLKFKRWDTVIRKPTPIQKIDVEAYLARLDSIESARQLEQQTSERNVKRTQGITSIQFKDQDSSPLFPFFEALDAAMDQGARLHVLHYGDSQIESDRMTGYLREQWQDTFGGRGPGLVAPVPLTASANIKQTQSSNWKRYTAYGYDQAKIDHGRFGVLASMGRFSPAMEKSLINPSDTLEGWIELSPSGMAKSHARVYSQAHVYFGYHQYPVQLNVLADDSLIDTRSFDPSDQLIHYQLALSSTPKKLRFVFKGPDSPEVQSILLDGNSGVYVDNIALRGSNGNIFKRIDYRDISSQIADLQTKLIILQFGGNSVPYVTTSEQAKDYASYFGAQIKFLKKMAPDASFLVIGPSDMSTSIDGEFQTWPGIPLVRDAMKEIAFAEGCGYWDMFEVMGGTNSMVSWVQSDPPYAGTDYTHFTPLGARKMAEFLYKSIQAEYDAWHASAN